MIKTYTFKTQDEIISGDPESIAEYEFTVKEDFINVCPKPENIGARELFDKHNMQKYLHSEFGPACVLLVASANRESSNPRGRMDTRQLAKNKGIPGYEDGVAHFGEYWIDGKWVGAEKSQIMLKAYVEHLKKQTGEVK